MARRRSLLITSRASTCFDISSTPSSAWSILRSPSKRNGMVTMPTVRMPSSLEMRAMTGAAPVPVPPPMPAVMNAILVPSFSILRTDSRLSSAASRAFAGLLPAPRPSLPSCKCTGTGESLRACASVLQSTNDTSWMPSLYMWLTALPPPPPTPITLIIQFSLCGSPKSRMFGVLHLFCSSIEIYAGCFFSVFTSFQHASGKLRHAHQHASTCSSASFDMLVCMLRHAHLHASPCSSACFAMLISMLRHAHYMFSLSA